MKVVRGLCRAPKGNSYNFVLCSLFSLLLVSLVARGETGSLESDDESDRTEQHWTFLGGYGKTHKGIGDTWVNVETIDFIICYEKKLTDTKGTSWYKGHHSLVVELPLHVVMEPASSLMTGINFIARWNFENEGKIKPYIFGGGGLLFVDTDIPGIGAHLNGNYQVGLGIRFWENQKRSLIMEYRFHHISNGGIKEPNDSLNSSKLLLGLSF